jgi:hypothetical protein
MWRKNKTYLNSSFLINSIMMSFSGWICSIFRMRHRKGVGWIFPPYTPPTKRSSIALSTSSSAVTQRKISYYYWLYHTILCSCALCSILTFIALENNTTQMRHLIIIIIYSKKSLINMYIILCCTWITVLCCQCQYNIIIYSTHAGLSPHISHSLKMPKSTWRVE